MPFTIGIIGAACAPCRSAISSYVCSPFDHFARPLAGADDWWLLTSLILFVGLGVLVPTVFLPHGKIFESALDDAKRRGEVTPELHTALRDPAVRNARAIELVVVAVILTLMVTKPF